MTTGTEIPLAELPDWMRHARQGIDWGMVLTFLFSLLIGLPFLTEENLPHTNASENYVYRTSDTAQSLQEGRLYPRWSPNALLGYGAPIPHYLPPAATYTTAVIQILFTADPLLAVRLTYLIALSMAGTAAYLLTYRQAGRKAGILAGVLYVYSPYIGLTVPHLSGDLPGVITFALMPLFLWSIERLLTRNSPGAALWVSLTTAALLLTDPASAVISTALGIGLIGLHWQTGHRVPWPRLITAYAIGFGISGFYWIPAILEQDAIHWQLPTIQQVFRLSLGELLSPIQQVDPLEMIASPQFTLGAPLTIFSLAGLGSIFYFRPVLRFHTLFLLMGIVLICMALLFFPTETHVLGGICLCLAVGGSVVLKWGELAPKLHRLGLPVLLIVIWISVMPVWLPPYVNDPFGTVDAKTQVQYELQGYGIAVMPPGEMIPSTIPDDLRPDRFLLDGYQSDNINKIAPAQLSTHGNIGVLEHNTHSDRFQVRTTSPLLLNVLTAYFPGWRATISNQPVPLGRNETTGLIEIDMPIVPADELSITLGTTPVRLGAWIIAGTSTLVLAVITWYRYRQQRAPVFYEEISPISVAEFRLLSVVLVCFGLIMVSLNNPAFPLSFRAPSGYVLENTVVIQNRTDTGVILMAFRLEGNQYRPGDTVPLTLYWQTQRSLTANHQAILYLTNNRDGSQWAFTELHHPGHYPTRRWKTGLYVTDEYALNLSSDIPVGNYQIKVELHLCNPDCKTDGQATFFSTNGQAIGHTLTLPTLITIGE